METTETEKMRIAKLTSDTDDLDIDIPFITMHQLMATNVNEGSNKPAGWWMATLVLHLEQFSCVCRINIGTLHAANNVFMYVATLASNSIYVVPR